MGIKNLLKFLNNYDDIVKEINKYLRHSNEVMLLGIYKLK